MKKMDARRERSLSDFLAGAIVGASLTLLVAAVRGSRVRNGSAWDNAWANSSAPLDLEYGGKGNKPGNKPDAEASTGAADGSALTGPTACSACGARH